MIKSITTIMTMFVGIILMHLTDNNRKKYTDYQINRMLREANIYAYNVVK
ncbi:MAG: hypothetical protein Q4E33_01960 [Erysipelotrichaceae bacterium]|nr:hypothetical protein [Erysipelotrichaceae bacterium]